MRDEWVEQSLRDVAFRNKDGFVVFYPDKQGGVDEFELIHWPIARLNTYIRDKGIENGSVAWKALKDLRAKVRNRTDFTTGMATSVRKQLMYLDANAANIYDIAWQAVEHLQLHKDCPFITTIADSPDKTSAEGEDTVGGVKAESSNATVLKENV